MRIMAAAINTLRYVDGNRRIDPKHVDRLAAAIKTNDLMRLRPVVINRNKEILDGQHRVEAYKILGKREIPCIMVEFAGDISDIQTINQHGKAWSLVDFAQSYASQKRKAYMEYLVYHQASQLPPSLCIEVLSGRTACKGGSHLRKRFIAGDFKVVNQKQAEEFMVAMVEVAQFLTPTRAITRSSVASALWNLYITPGYDHKRLMRKLSIGKVPKIRLTIGEMTEQFLETYNYHEATKLEAQPKE